MKRYVITGAAGDPVRFAGYHIRHISALNRAERASDGILRTVPADKPSFFRRDGQYRFALDHIG